MRLDLYLTAKGLARSRNKAQEMIRQGAVVVGGRVCRKAAQDVAQESVQVQSAPEFAYVSRAALKLKAIFEAPDLPDGLQARIDVAGKRCLDIGASTGGFTQVLLERGARSVVALDVGHGQLAPALRIEARVLNLEGINIRDIQTQADFTELATRAKCNARSTFSVRDPRAQEVARSSEDVRNIAQETAQRSENLRDNRVQKTARSSEDVRKPAHDVSDFQIIVADISFISITFAIPALKALLAPEGIAIVLVKPQFELGKAAVSKLNGVVQSDEMRQKVLRDVQEKFRTAGLTPEFTIPSPLLGSKGNQEFVMIVRGM